MPGTRVPVRYAMAYTKREHAFAPLGNEETSLSGIASITIDTASFYSHVRQLYRDDKFACRRALRNTPTREQVSSQFFVIRVRYSRRRLQR